MLCILLVRMITVIVHLMIQSTCQHNMSTFPTVHENVNACNNKLHCFGNVLVFARMAHVHAIEMPT